MIRIGLSTREKLNTIGMYLAIHEAITKIKVFYFNRLPLSVDFYGVQTECVEYSDIIMYKYFYRLLEEIDDKTLLVFNEVMRTQNRSDLTYNCAHHYCNQTPHKVIFEHFPIIEDKNDFMILLDLQNKGRYKGKGFDYTMLHEEDIQIKPHRVNLVTVPVETTDKDRERYEAKRENLFANLGRKTPTLSPHPADPGRGHQTENP